jgi:hypothetical protein
MNRYYFFGLLAFLFPVILIAADVKKGYTLADFMRVTKQEGKKLPVSYETSIVKFVDKKSNAEVDLIGAIHIGDKEYYTELNKIFKRYDAVLYELVAEADTKPTKSSGKSDDGGQKSVLSSFQSGMGSALALDFQLNHIDYHARNMVHADLNPSEFARRVSDRGDIVQMLYRAMILGIKKSGQEAQKDELKMQGRLLGSFFASDPALSLKRVLAEEMMNQLDDATWLIGGEDGSAIITDRNEAALKVLRKKKKNGKKKIAIFYGAAHLAEFAKSLEKDFQMKHTGTDWIVAWDLTKDKSARKQSP